MNFPFRIPGWTTAEKISSQVLPPEPSVPANYLLLADLIHITVVGLTLGFVLFGGTVISFWVQLVLTLLIIYILMRNGVWLVFGALQFGIWMREPRIDQAVLSAESLLYALLCLGLVAYSAGFQTIRRELRQWLGLLMQVLLEASSDGPQVTSVLGAGSDEAVLEQVSTGAAHRYWLREKSGRLIMRVLRLMLVILIAGMVFAQLPFTRVGVRQWWDRSVNMDMVFWPGPGMFLAAIAGLTLLSIFSWRALSRDQAGLYLRSFFIVNHYRELRSILVRGNRLEAPYVAENKAGSLVQRGGN